MAGLSALEIEPTSVDFDRNRTIVRMRTIRLDLDQSGARTYLHFDPHRRFPDYFTAAA